MGEPSLPKAPVESDWQPIDTAPENVLVKTKIDDAYGVRNEQPMRLRRSLWFITDNLGEDLMYVYYRPTHWASMDVQS